MNESLHIDAASSSSSESQSISFQYKWPFIVHKRLIENDEAIVFNVSPPFASDYNGVQFTWILKLSDEFIDPSESVGHLSKHTFVYLYYKEGPASVPVEHVKIWIGDENNEEVFNGLHLGAKEFSRGCFWSVHIDNGKQEQLTKYFHERVNSLVNINVDIKIKKDVFEPENFIHQDGECHSVRIENSCGRFIDELMKNKVTIPNIQLIETQDDKFAAHRLVFLYGCDVVESECFEGKNQPNEQHLALVRTTFARVYFDRILRKELVDLSEDDLVIILEAIESNPIVALRKEFESFVCQLMLKDDGNPMLAKRVLLIAEKYSLDILKMVSSSVVVNKIIAHEDPPREWIEMKNDLHQFASQMSNGSSSSQDSVPADDESTLVGCVVENLQSMTRRIRRVSLSHSPSTSSSPSATPNDSSSLSPIVDEQPTPFDSPNHGRFKRVELF